MAARSVLKLFTKTCTYSLNSACPSSLVPRDEIHKLNIDQGQRSYSQPRRHVTENFVPIRKISKSLENLRGKFSKKIGKYFEPTIKEKQKVEDSVENEYEEEQPTRRNYFQTAVDMSYREPAKEFKDKEAALEKNEEGNPIYELAESSRNQEDVYDVRKNILQSEFDKPRRLFPHLQPSNLKPYGSNENLHFTSFLKKKMKIVYPVVHTTTTQQEPSGRRRVDDVHYKEYSSYQDSKKLSLHENRSRKALNQKHYSTTCAGARKIAPESKPPKLAIGLRKSSSSLLKKKIKKKFQFETVLEANRVGILNQFYKHATAFKEMREMEKKNRNSCLGGESRNISPKKVLLNKSKNSGEEHGRSFSSATKKDKFSTKSSLEVGTKKKPSSFSKDGYHLEERGKNYTTYTKPSTSASECFVTVKLRELQEECRRQKKCKAKKISFGKLPKLIPPDCPCINDLPLKEGKPLKRIQKKFDVVVKKEDCEVIVCDTPRADANYKITKKSLPRLQLRDCPCVEKEYVDFKIKRLPKKKVAEPPRICLGCVGEECCPPRSDANLKIKMKKLPKLRLNSCPCVEAPPPNDVPLLRLKPKIVKQPKRVCLSTNICEETPRADDSLKVVPKRLPTIKSLCACIEPPPMLDVPPLQRLKKIKYIEKPRESCDVIPCQDAVRADRCLKVKEKRLPVFKPKPCPCIEPEPPSIEVKLKRLVPKEIPKVERVCPVEMECKDRADDGLKVGPRSLPIMEPGDCPCVETDIVDVPPLKRLIPRPVREPERICPIVNPCLEITRSDECLKVEQRNLPLLPPGNCPCKEEPPMTDTPPLAKLKKRPVAYTRICPEAEPCPPRADENLKVKIKRLPKLNLPDCPCIDPPAPEDVPLRRLKKAHVPEPTRVCPVVNICDEIPRADEDDWLYWKRVEVSKSDPSKTNKRCFSTSTKPENDLFQLKYDISSLRTSQMQGQSYNVVIDIKPSAPLILTQTPIKLDDLEDVSFPNKALRRSKSEPVDCVRFAIYKSNTLAHSQSKSGMMVKDSNDGFNLFCNRVNRFISTCSTLYEYSERTKDNLRDHHVPQCECPANDAHLQPKNPIIPEKETFIEPYPDQELIDDSIKKSRMYYHTRKESKDTKHLTEAECEDEDEKALGEVGEERSLATEKKLSLWERVVNYFKARPDCPSPEEFKKMRLKEDAEKAASKAGLCLYDPKEMLRKNEKELPKVITADGKDECRK